MLNPLLNSDNPLTAALCCNRLPVCLSVCVCLEKCGNRLDLFQHHEGGAHDWAPSTHPHMMTHFFFLNMNFKLFFPTRTEREAQSQCRLLIFIYKHNSPFHSLPTQTCLQMLVQFISILMDAYFFSSSCVPAYLQQLSSIFLFYFYTV